MDGAYRMSDFKRQLAKEFAESEEYRESYAEHFANEYITAQIKLNRKGRNLNQSQLGELIESNQGRVSLYEDKEYGRWNIETLRKIAARLGCWLKISIEPYGTLLDQAERFSAPELLRPAFENDPEIQRWLSAGDAADLDPFAASRRIIADWLNRNTDDLKPLCAWLQGDLPGYAGDSEEFQWILWALEPAPEAERLRLTLARRLAVLMGDWQVDANPIGWRPSVLVKNVFLLAANLAMPSVLQNSIDAAYRREVEYRQEHEGARLDASAVSALRIAMEHNQADERWAGVWNEMIVHGKHSVLPGARHTGMEGLLGLQPGLDDPVYWERLASGIRLLEQDLHYQGTVVPGKIPDAIEQLKQLIDIIFARWKTAGSAIRLLRAALTVGWLQEAGAAWACSVSERDWKEVIEKAPNPLSSDQVRSAIFDGLAYHANWTDPDIQAREEELPHPTHDTRA
jgi:transcriptional regulator with XRE-family HTH domain